jgi:rhamnopyranosyl-N-acetylglucosaminyl-diphospho-decaprenol beta-1,3/1,4-galactofuranosyltransferase
MNTELQQVCAVVVTYNRAGVLKDCLLRLQAQQQYGLGHIHVVINSSDEETIQVIRMADEGRKLISYSHYNNEGPAGGFHYGLARFLDGPWNYVWLMDDDVMVEKECLLELMKLAPEHAYIFPKVIKMDGDEIVSFGWWGVILSRTLVERAGLPIKEFFYWAEDTEYLQNRIMRKLGEKPYRCTTAVVTHLHQRNVKRPSWYYYYTMRNTLYYRNYLAGYTWYRFKRTLYLFPQSLFRILFKEENKIRKIGLLFYGLYHGAIGKIGKLVDPTLNK